MITLDEYSYDEQIALDNERQAFRRMQSAHFGLVKQSMPQGSGVLVMPLLDEYEQAYANWQKACVVLEQIGREIQAEIRR